MQHPPIFYTVVTQFNHNYNTIDSTHFILSNQAKANKDF